MKLNGYRFAELAVGESLQSPDVCDCCGREDLKRTVKLINPAGRVVWFGTGCAAKAMSVGIDEVRAARKDAVKRERANAWKAQDEAARIEDAKWQDFLNRAAGFIYSWDGGPINRYAQIEKLGGYKAARDAFAAEGK